MNLCTAGKFQKFKKEERKYTEKIIEYKKILNIKNKWKGSKKT